MSELQKSHKGKVEWVRDPGPFLATLGWSGLPQRLTCPIQDASFPALRRTHVLFSFTCPSFLLCLQPTVEYFFLLLSHFMGEQILNCVVPLSPGSHPRPLSCRPGTVSFHGVHTNFCDCGFVSAEAHVRTVQRALPCLQMCSS